MRLFFLRHGYLIIAAAWLITFAFLVNNYWLYYSSPKGVRNTLEKSIQSREIFFEEILNDRELIQKLGERDYDEATLKKICDPDRGVYLFIFKEDWLTFWSTNAVNVEFNAQMGRLGVQFRKMDNGYYEVIGRIVPGFNKQRYHVVGLIPVKLEYFIRNKYLPNHYFGRPEIGEEYVINTNNKGLPVYSSKGKQLFSLDYRPSRGTPHASLVSIVLRVMALICILVFINLFAVFLVKQLTPWHGFFFLTATMVFLRILSYLYPFPFHFRDFGLFSSQIYATSAALPSLGDLLINVLLIFWLVLFYRDHLAKIPLPNYGKHFRSALTIVCCLFIYAVGQFASGILKSLVIDSRISFDVTNFFSLNAYSIIGFVILGFIAFTFFFFSQIINQYLDQLVGYQRNTKYTFVAATGILWLLMHLSDPNLGFSLGLMVWLLVYVFLLDEIHERFFNELATVPFLFWLLLLTITTTSILVFYNTQREAENRKIVAIRLSKQQDPVTDYILDDIGKKIMADKEIPLFFFSKRYEDKRVLAEHLQANYFGYLNRFDTKIYTFDDSDRPIYNVDTLSMYSLDTIISKTSKPTNTPGLYYQELSFNRYSYLGKLEVISPINHQKIGSLYYQLKPKVIKNETLYPELLVEDEVLPMQYSNVYSYAVYVKNNLVANYNDYSFPMKLSLKDIPMTEFSYKEENGYSQLWYKASKDKLIVVVKQSRNFIEAITLFAYMFCIFLLIVGLYRMADLLIRTRMRWSLLKDALQPNFRKQVHSTIIFVVVFAFVILGIATISFFIDRYDKSHRDKLSQNINTLSIDIENIFQEQHTFDDVKEMYDPLVQDKLSIAVDEIANIHGVDLNIYNLDGTLRLTTQRFIYEKGLLSKKIDPLAFYQMHNLNKIQYIQQERIGSLRYLSSYVPLRDEDGEVFAYLNIPYFASQSDLNQEISNFLVALINLNAFIFLLSGLIALFITNTITKSFTLIREKLRQVSLAQLNDEIEWHRDDEIGMLVKEYNKMVRKLEVSAAMLAKSEREGAWREMARQVAHEIKNPLTPMKLSIQYLQNAIRSNAPNVQELSGNMAKTLIEQIDHLAQIASDFSAFANIMHTKNEVLLLNEVLNSVISLYQTDARNEINYDTPAELFHVFADKTQLNRLFTNLLQNAVQAIPEGRHGIVNVVARRNGETVLVTIQDNGEGIPEEVRNRIFIPNFTTKSSGTGLGLAMCKNIVEQAKGNIWFDTRVGEGTTFYVELPLIEK